MSRRHQKVQHKPAGPAPRAATPEALGLKAFHAANYSEAIRLWSQRTPDSNPAVRAALAEAHFRRAVTARIGQTDPLPEMRRAVDLAPGEARYWFQIGLMLHRANRMEEARLAYARAAEQGLSRRSFSIVRGLAELESDPTLTLDALPWLSQDARTSLEPISALLRHEPQAAVATTARDGAPITAADPITSLWRGLALLEVGDASGARTALAPPQGQRLPIGAEAARVFYYGLATALAGDMHGALALWTEQPRSGAQTHAQAFPRLDVCVARLTALRVSELQGAEKWTEALAQAQAGLARGPESTWLLQAALISANRLAEVARESGDWAGAFGRWQTMRGILEAYPGLGPLPPVLHNLALANEALEEWEQAAQMWAALLGTMRRRSGRAAKKPAVDAEDALLDEKRIWLRRRILDNYKRAGRPDEAIAYYKQAVKSDPENLALRVELATALLSNEQTIAARNEVQRILGKDPEYIDALLLQAQIHEERGEDYDASQSLRRILEIDPNHDTARRGMAHLLLERGMSAFNYGQYPQARNCYTEALKFSPNDVQLRVFLGETEIRMGKVKDGKAHFEAALATGEVLAYIVVFTLWIRQQNEEEARKILERAQSTGIAEPQFYVDAGVVCLTRTTPSTPAGSFARPGKSHTPTQWERWGRELIQQGLDTAPNRIEALHHLILALGPPHADIAILYARELVGLEPDDLENYMLLALMQGMTEDAAEGRKTLDRAAQLARKQGNKDMIDKIAEMRREISSPMFGMMSRLTAMGITDPFDLDDED